MIRRKIKERWGKLTAAEIDDAEGHWGRLSDLVQQRDARTRHEVEKEIKQFREAHDPGT